MAVGVLIVAALLLRWAHTGWATHRWGWARVEQTGWVVGIVSGVLTLAGSTAAMLGTKLRRPRRSAGLVQVGRVPSAAAWLQDRVVRVDLARAAGAGRAAVSTLVLSGMGGVGKTQLAAQFARDLTAAGELDVLLWVTAAGQDSIVAGYSETARALGLADGDIEPQTAAQRLTAWLEHTDLRWLIVLDSLDTPADAIGWWPPAKPNGRTVVTTRRRDAALHTDSRAMISVGLFTPPEADAYLTHAIGTVQPSDDVSGLASDLGHLPLAVAQAAAFIRERGIDCATYRSRLADYREQLTSLAPSTDALPDDHRDTVAATWALSINAADDSPPQGVAKLLMNIAALLDPNRIPVAVFTGEGCRAYVTGGEDSEPVAETEFHVRRVEDALHNLHRLNLITYDRDSGSVRVHALIQRATRDQLRPDQLAVLARTAADALSKIWPEVGRDPAYAQTLRANTTALAASVDNYLWTPVDGAHIVLFQAGDSLGDTGLVTAAVNYFHQLRAESHQRLGPDHPNTMAVRHKLANWRGQAGDATGAAEAFEQLLTDRLRILGPEHSDTLATRGNLAHWRGLTGDAKGAATALEQLLTDVVRILGPRHPETLTTRVNVARWQGKAGNAAGAANAFEQVRADVLRILGPDHTETLTVRHYLASWRGQAGDAVGAATAFEQLLTDYLRVLGPDHPRTLTTRYNLASWQGQAGDALGAATAFGELLTDRLRILGPEHPNTLATRRNFAAWQGQAGDAASAATALERLLTDVIRILGPHHPETLATRYELASWQGQAGDALGAATAFGELLTDRLRILGPEHPDTLATRRNFAAWQGQAGDAASAATALERLLTDVIRILGPHHPETLKTRRDLNFWRHEA